MTEDVCPACNTGFDEKKVYDTTTSLSFATQRTERICVWPVEGGRWVYFHLE